MTHTTDPGLSAITDERGRLTGLAYRLLGSLAEADDVVQEASARWYAMPEERRAEIANPAAWLTTVATRICLDVLGSARARREQYVGAWLPEPLPGSEDWHAAGPADPADPADRVTLDESVSMAFLVVYESMTPAERVVFVLHDVFRYTFPEVAEIVGRSPEACRQLATSARRRVRAGRPPAAAAAADRQAADVVGDFKRAWAAKDIPALVDLLDPDARLVADGGGLANAALKPVEGGELVARFLAAFADRTDGLAVEECPVNGHPGLVARQHGRAVSVAALEVTAGRITRIWAIRNPEKLHSW
ncbi:RNA polymerase subunit sigma-24 [Mangrovactinospora gilvigrisea]|uniref:RNA polymerase subunit sigma-24 n=1 Tax=Mangrovactinospora gilvigrisea TaxID=1428644 RepID=A0A1J7BA66_9ACTN|nr:RNA polymerase sigma factor SigJ [Mangrovactinospora gilvigrisea]OIV35547.1 RNA polymerase subunit sigma-24 [Mangrovactinospora gilvigrisea]